MTRPVHDIRNKALQSRRNMTAENRRNASRIICNRLSCSREFSSASLIACYLPMRDEVDTWPIIECAWRANKRIFVPVTHDTGEMFFREIRPNTTLHRNRMMILEPQSGAFISARQLQLVVTPTVAFSLNRHRIGMGGGYYDRCFSFLRNRKHWLKPKLVGVAFNCQKVKEITPNVWDIQLYRVFHDA